MSSSSHQTASIILGIETSCDDTSVALVSSDRQIIATHTTSSANIHATHGGVVPEIAAREHLYSLQGVISATLNEADISLQDIDGIAATAGPGLIGGVIVGTMTAKAIASALAIPYYAVNHLEGHALTARLTDDINYPFLLLLVSGGHTQLLIVKGLGLYERLGTTMDDAAGEAFDKGAALMGLGYPGGPAIQKLASLGDERAIQLPSPRQSARDCHFSFSGLKTAFAQSYQKLAADEARLRQADYAASLQYAIANALTRRTEIAMQKFTERYPEPEIANVLVVAGGVAANQAVRDSLTALSEAQSFQLVTPPVSLCTDNGAMIAWVGHEYHRQGSSSPLDFAPRPRWPLDNQAPPPPGRGVRHA